MYVIILFTFMNSKGISRSQIMQDLFLIKWILPTKLHVVFSEDDGFARNIIQ